MGRLQQVDLRGVGLLVVLGRGRDGLVERVLSAHPLVRRVLVIDPSPKAAVELPDSERLAVISDPTGADLAAKLHLLLRQVPWLRYVRTMQVTPASSTVSDPWTQAALGALKAAAVASLRYYGNDPADALLGLRHILANLDWIRGSADFGSLTGALAGRTAVVASAGPSLDGALEQLAEVQDRLVIVAPDTSLKPLLAAGIRPHIVTAKERTERTIPLLQGVNTDGIILAALPLLPPAALAGWGGAGVAVYSGGSHFPWLNAAGLMRSTLRFDGSAGNMAFRVCEELGATRVILVGQDLCFGPGGSSHTSGATNPQSQELISRQQRIRLPGVSGRPVYSTPTWREFIEVFEVDLQRFGGTCVNTSPSGALIRGAVQMPLAEALAGAGDPYDARAILGAGLADESSEFDCIEALETARYLVRRTVELCREGAGAAVAASEGGVAGDVDALLQTTLSEVQELRTRVLRQPLFHEVMTPVIQSAVVEVETSIYAHQREAVDDRDLLDRVSRGWVRWFEIVARLAEATGAELDSARPALEP